MERLDIKSSGLAWWGMIFLWNVFQRLNFRLIFLLDTKANDMWQISHVKNWGNGVPYRVTKYLSGSYVFPLVIFWYSWKLIIPIVFATSLSQISYLSIIIVACPVFLVLTLQTIRCGIVIKDY